MRFPGKHLIEGISSWIQRKKSVSEAEKFLADKSDDEKLRASGAQSEPAAVSVKIAVKDIHAEDDDALKSKMSEETALETTAINLSEPIKSNISPFPVKASTHFTPEKKTPFPDQGQLPRLASPYENLETDDHLVTDIELATLEAENTRLKRLLNDQLKSSGDGVGD